MAEPRLRRTLLMTPGNREDRLRKAASCAADALVYDLEDGVPPAEKARARACVNAVLDAPADDGRERCVRINGLDTPYGLDDLQALPYHRIDSIMVPKVESADALRDIDVRLKRLRVDHGRARPVEIIALVETPRGVLKALEIADATPRTTALFFGSGDYTSALGAAVSSATLHYPRAVIAAAAAAAGLQAIDAAFFLDVKNAQATREDALEARAFGFAGKVVFHPNQIAPVNDVFSPAEAEIERARRIVAAHEEQLQRGLGTGVVDGMFVAVDLVPPARRLLRLAEMLAQRQRVSTPDPATRPQP
jgi:citrate lyase subunit beta/citryl-CoA lyase